MQTDCISCSVDFSFVWDRLRLKPKLIISIDVYKFKKITYQLWKLLDEEKDFELDI